MIGRSRWESGTSVEWYELKVGLLGELDFRSQRGIGLSVVSESSWRGDSQQVYYMPS